MRSICTVYAQIPPTTLSRRAWSETGARFTQPGPIALPVTVQGVCYSSFPPIPSSSLSLTLRVWSWPWPSPAGGCRRARGAGAPARSRSLSASPSACSSSSGRSWRTWERDGIVYLVSIISMTPVDRLREPASNSQPPRLTIQEANSIEILKGQLTSQLRFTVLNKKEMSFKNLQRQWI